MNDFQRFLESQRRAAQGGAPAGPGAILARAVGMVAAVGLIALSLVFGAFVLTALLAIGLLGGVALRVWLWWQQRKYGASPTPPNAPYRRAQTRAASGEADVVEGEFEVLDEQGSPPQDRRGPD